MEHINAKRMRLVAFIRAYGCPHKPENAGVRVYGHHGTGPVGSPSDCPLRIGVPRKNSRWERGLSLPEVLVACLISLIGIGALLATFLTGRFATERAQHYTQAMNLARARIEQLKSLPYRDLSSIVGVTTETGLALDEAQGGGYVPCDRTTTLTEEDNGITIAVTVSWMERASGAGSRPWSYDLKTWAGSPKRDPTP